MASRKKLVTISVRIPEWLKREMDDVGINWSEYIRCAIEKRVALERLKRIWEEIEEIKNSGGIQDDSGYERS